MQPALNKRDTGEGLLGAARHSHVHVQYIHLLPVAMVLLGLLCRINKLLHCGQGAGICIRCEYQVLIG